jgi:hypothetical protein
MSNSYFNNNVIFPGNQVTHLNAYRNQGVQAIPGVNFFVWSVQFVLIVS